VRWSLFVQLFKLWRAPDCVALTCNAVSFLYDIFVLFWHYLQIFGPSLTVLVAAVFATVTVGCMFHICPFSVLRFLYLNIFRYYCVLHFYPDVVSTSASKQIASFLLLIVTSAPFVTICLQPLIS
jgi:hypothetical protein